MWTFMETSSPLGWFWYSMWCFFTQVYSDEPACFSLCPKCICISLIVSVSDRAIICSPDILFFSVIFCLFFYVPISLIMNVSYFSLTEKLIPDRKLKTFRCAMIYGNWWNWTIDGKMAGCRNSAAISIYSLNWNGECCSFCHTYRINIEVWIDIDWRGTE